MALTTWWRDDYLPVLPPLNGFQVSTVQDDTLLAGLSGLDGREIKRRRQEGHRPYAGFLSGVPAAYGWVATRRAAIGELNLDFRLPPLHRYLWDFATLPDYRGRGIYPHLLQEILMREVGQGYYFWIIRAPENWASGSGIRKAGFKAVGRLSLLENGRTGLAVTGSLERAASGAALLGVPIVETGLFPCWHCGGADYPPAAGAAHCLCEPDDEDECCCIVRPEKGKPLSIAGRQGVAAA